MSSTTKGNGRRRRVTFRRPVRMLPGQMKAFWRMKYCEMTYELAKRCDDLIVCQANPHTVGRPELRASGRVVWIFVIVLEFGMHRVPALDNSVFAETE